MPYTNIAKPTDSTYTKVAKDSIDVPVYGTAIYGVNKYGVQNAYTGISKPTGSSYTNIAKPT